MGTTLNLCFYPLAVRVVLSVCAALCVMACALAFVLSLYRYRRKRLYFAKCLLAFLMLCLALLCAGLIAQVQLYAENGFLVLADNAATRAILTSRVFPPVFFAAIAVLTLGGVWFSLLTRKELRVSVSGLSVKQAMDSLDTAVLFYQQSGHILLQNNKMRELMLQTAGQVYFNGRLFFEALVIPNAERTGTNSYLYRLPESAWLFSVETILLGKVPVTRMTADDVTEQERAGLALRREQETLKTRHEQLKTLVGSIKEISRSEELLRIRNETHDAQNKKLTLLLRYLRHGKWPDPQTFSEISAELQRGLLHAGAEPAHPRDALSALIRCYRQAGIELRVYGDLSGELPGRLPYDFRTAHALVRILREATANAVIHGYANRVYARITEEDGRITMRVTDNSRQRPSAKPREGGGVANMRRRAESLGGTLSIDTARRFILTVTIPKGVAE